MVSRVSFGYTKFADKNTNKQQEVVWDERSITNAHVIACGGSGCGKTHFLRSMIGSIAQGGTKTLRIHIIDIHGDITIPGESVVSPLCQRACDTLMCVV